MNYIKVQDIQNPISNFKRCLEQRLFYKNLAERRKLQIYQNLFQNLQNLDLPKDPPEKIGTKDFMVEDEEIRVKDTTTPETEIIRVEGLRRVFKSRKKTVHAVRGVSWSAERGQVFGLLGTNGAGKTTTFKMMCG